VSHALWYLAGMISGLCVLAVITLIADRRLDTANDRQIRRQAAAGITALEQILREEADQ